MMELLIDPSAQQAYDEAAAALAGLDLPTDVPAPYQVSNGIAIIGVRGMLFQNIGTLYDLSWASGYDAIGTKLELALRDDQVRGIALDVNTPGGPVPGLFDLCDAIYAARDRKPIQAILTEMALSAGYAIASSASGLWLPQTGFVGSIGAIWSHTDISRMLDQAGITITDITFGARKGDGSPTAPLSSTAKDAAQARINAIGELFVDTVARNRDMTASTVRGTEAAIYMGEAGVRSGLADGIASPASAFQAFVASL